MSNRMDLYNPPQDAKERRAELLGLVDKNGPIPYTYKTFVKDCKEIQMRIVQKTASRLRKAGWPEEDITKFRLIAIKGHYFNLIETCLTTFEES